MDRGKFIPLRVRPLLSVRPWRLPWTRIQVPGLSLYRHHIQIWTRFLQLMKIVFLGALVAGVGSGRDSLAQIVILFFAALGLMITLRLARPYPSRMEMAISLTEEAADVIFVAMALLLLVGPQENESFRDHIGIGMITVECCSFLAITSDRLILSLNGFSLMRQRRRNRKETKLTRLFFRYLSKNAYFLQRKYFDRWMIKALKKGLYGRPARRTELPISYLIEQEMNKIKKGFSWWFMEIYLVWHDLCMKFRSLLNKLHPSACKS